MAALDPALEAFIKTALGFLPPAIQKDLGYVLADAPVAIDAYNSVRAAITKMPPRADRTVVSVMVAFGIPPEAPLYKAALLADMIEEQVKAAQATAPTAP